MRFHIQATGSAFWQKLTMLRQDKTKPEIISLKITKQQQLKGGKGEWLQTESKLRLNIENKVSL